MTNRAVTFDFHNTLASCDGWFDVEVRHLVSAFLRWDAVQRGLRVAPELSESADLLYRKLRKGIHAHGHELPAERCVAVVLDQMGIPHDAERLAIGMESIMARFIEDTAPKSGAIETVRALSASGIRIGVVSSAVYHRFLEWTLDRFGIRDAISEIVTSASVGYYKSRPEIYWSALARLGAEPAKSVHVGDSLRFDIGGAASAGMRTALITNGSAYAPDPAYSPDLIAERLDHTAAPIRALLDWTPGDRNANVPAAVPFAPTR